MRPVPQPLPSPSFASRPVWKASSAVAEPSSQEIRQVHTIYGVNDFLIVHFPHGNYLCFIY